MYHETSDSAKTTLDNPVTVVTFEIITTVRIGEESKGDDDIVTELYKQINELFASNPKVAKVDFVFAEEFAERDTKKEKS